MHILTEQTLSLVENAISQHGAKEIEKHHDIYILDSLMDLYLSENGESVSVSVKEILDMPKKFNIICKDFHITLAEDILNALIESEFEDGAYLIKDPLLKEFIYVDYSFYNL